MESKELEFFGKITAGVTHELKNVLAIINESNGLMADLFGMAKDMDMPYRDRFLRSISKIEGQVKRGVDIIGRFNRFSHSVDNEVAKVDLNEVIDLTVALAQRFARLKNIEIKSAISSDPIWIITSPFKLQMALTNVIEACIGRMNSAGSILLSVNADNSPRINFICEDLDGERIELGEGLRAFPSWEVYEQAAESVRSTAELGPETGGFSIILAPVHSPDIAK